MTDLTTKAELTDPLDLFQYLNKIGRKHGVGRVDIVENRFVGTNCCTTLDSVVLTELGPKRAQA